MLTRCAILSGSQTSELTSLVFLVPSFPCDEISALRARAHTDGGVVTPDVKASVKSPLVVCHNARGLASPRRLLNTPTSAALSTSEQAQPAGSTESRTVAPLGGSRRGEEENEEREGH
ncbi:hypothetical protein HPB47_027079 [Ixodes persulcatus]|uniref:Uncharacterized protein n=1 Tax=Ixodes persulcatus TaxID=34615 RepID=A0AC60PX25_IXOPE|nr:hypothetical protein HPB47_027079 [Ixodes persulcatus]